MKKTDQNETRQKLEGLPFKSATDLKQAQDALRFAVWKRLEQAKIISELTTKPEYAFWRKEFESGLACLNGEKINGQLFRVFSDGPGIKVQINQGLVDTMETRTAVIEALVKSLSESFSNTYYKAKGILPADENVNDSDKVD